jgi:hypothetical protein
MSEPDPLDRDRMWVAGLLEADGAFYVTRRASGVHRGRIQCRLADRDVLERLRDVLDAGCLNGPYSAPGGAHGRKLTWVYQINRQEDVARVSRQLMPEMGRRRQQQMSEMLGLMEGDVSRGTSMAEGAA